MTNEKINETIATHIFGYEDYDMLYNISNPTNVHRKRKLFGAKKNDDYWTLVPDYCNDLNAIHEAILSLPFGLRDNTFALILANVCGFKAHGVESWSQLHAGCFAVINATAAQRAEAFLKTIEKWKE